MLSSSAPKECRLRTDWATTVFGDQELSILPVEGTDPRELETR